MPLGAHSKRMKSMRLPQPYPSRLYRENFNLDFYLRFSKYTPIPTLACVIPIYHIRHISMTPGPQAQT